MNIYEQKYTVLASDMDITYHITPNAIMLYFQDCFARFLTSCNLAAFDIIKRNLIWIISDLEVRFVNKRPLWSSDIKVRIRFREISTIRIYVDYWILDAQDIPFVEGTSTWAIIDSVTKRPFAAKQMLNDGGIITNDDEKACKPRVVDTSNKVFDRDVEHLVNVTDLDFNGHVCNRTYLFISLATLPLDFIKKYSPSYINIKFTREAFFGEKLVIRISKDGDEKYWYDVLNSQGKCACAIYTEWENQEEYMSMDVSELVKR